MPFSFSFSADCTALLSLPILTLTLPWISSSRLTMFLTSRKATWLNTMRSQWGKLRRARMCLILLKR